MDGSDVFYDVVKSYNFYIALISTSHSLIEIVGSEKGRLKG